MFNRRTTGSVVCPSCGSLVGVRDDKCYSCGRSNPGLWGFGPVLRSIGADFGFAPMVIGACVTIWVVMLLMSGGGIGVGNVMSALSPSPGVMFLFGESGAVPVFGAGRWWTVLSAGWLHAGLLHILMNMYWVHMMGPSIAELFGPARTVIIYTVGGVAGFLLSSVMGAFLGGIGIPFLHGAGYTVGASAPVFGLIGALYHYGRTSSSSVKQQATFFMVQAVVIGLLIPNVDNSAHLGGFIGGYLTSAVLNPNSPERGDHTLIAVGCLTASLLAIAASILTGAKYLV
jgi:membrane associated rhomboid family serine protease